MYYPNRTEIGSKDLNFPPIPAFNSMNALAIINRHNNFTIRILPYLYVAKLLQKSEMRKDIVIELSYKGFG